MSLNPYDDTLQGLDAPQQGPPANPYLDTLDTIDTTRTRELRTSLAQATTTSPDRAAEARRIADTTGVSYEIVDRNFDAIKKRAAAEDSQAAQLLRDSPHVAAWASDPQNAAVAHDDLPQLSTMETALRHGRKAAGALGAGVMGFAQGVYGSVQAAAEIAQGVEDVATGTFNVLAHPWQSLVRTSYWAAGKGAPDQSSGVAQFATGAAATAGRLADLSRGEQPNQGPVPGQVEHGNVDLYAQPKVKNADGSISTVDSLSVNMDGKEVLLPTVTPDGRHFTGTPQQKRDQAVAEYQKTGRHLGIFDTPEAADAYAQQLHADYAKGLYDVAPPSFVERAIYSGIESAGQMIPTLVLGLVMGPEAALAAVGVTTGGQEYSQARAQGLSVPESAVVGTIQGAVEVATEYIPTHRLLGDVAAKAPLWKTLMRQMAAEIPGEEVATVLQDLNEWAFLPANKDRTFGDYLRERPSAAAATLISVIVGTGLQTVGTHGTVRMLEQLGGAVEQSKTAQRSPEAIESFIAQATKDTSGETLYQPIATWREYWQSKGVDPAQAAVDVLGSRTAYDEAVRLGTDLEIPTARYAVKIAGTEHNAFFTQELRAAPDVMNGREATAFAQEQAARTTAQNQQTEPSPVEQVRALVTEQLTAAGIPKATAETYAALYEGAFGAMAQRAGLNPAELYARYGLTVQRPDVAQPQAPASAPAPTQPTTTPAPTTAPAAPGEAGGPVAATPPAADAPTAVFAFLQPDGQGGNIPMYHVVGGPMARSTVSAETLVANGIAVPEAPAVDTTAGTADTTSPDGVTTPAGEQLPRHAPQPVVAAVVGQDVGGSQTAPADEGASLRIPATSRGLFADLLTDARANGYTGSDDSLAAHFLAKLATAREMAGDLEQTANDHGWRDLLVEISKAGGIGLDAEGDGGYTGEIKWLMEGLSGSEGLIKRGRRAGQYMPRLRSGIDGAPGVFRGKGQGGLSLDTIREHLAQDPRWEHRYANGFTELMEDLEVAVGKGHIENQSGVGNVPGDATPNAMSILDGFLEVRPGSSWWTEAAPIDEGQALATDVGDTSFNPAEFFQSLFDLPLVPHVDTLPTGEQQPRLPGDVGAVRTQEVPTPTMEAPFALTSEVSKAKAGKQTTLFQPKRGSIRFGEGTTTITLFEHADLTTVLHEGAHLFAQVLTDLATKPDANPQIAADFAALKAAYPDESAPASAFSEQQHESIARAFEAYLMEGKAPSVELRSAFSRMRAWLLGVYRALTNLNVRLNPQVRQVFDRMLATDAAIAEAAAVGHVAPMFLTPEGAGMTPEEFALYRDKVAAASRTATERLDRQLMAEVQREQTAQWTAQRELVEADVAAQVHQQPEYRAMAAIRTGTYPDGTPLAEGQEPLKLSKAILVDRYGDDRVKALPKPYLYTTEGGLDPETVADLFGFSSGDEMLTAIERAPAMDALIQQYTERRMLAQHGSILLDGSIHDRAKAALANEDAEVVARAELAALAKLQREVQPFIQAERGKARAGVSAVRAAIPPDKVLREQARQRVAGTRVRDLKPHTFWVAGRRAARAALDAMAGQNYDAAIFAKQQELLNLALYREATNALDDVDARVKRAKDLAKGPARQRLGKAGESYLDQVDGILDRYEFAAVTQKALDRRASLRKWVAALEGQGLPVDLPEQLLDESRRVNYRELTIEELVGVSDGLDQIVHLARLKNRLLKSADQRDFDEVRDAIAGSILEHTPVKDIPLEIRPADDAVRKVKAWFASHAKIARLARALDGHADGGAMWEHIIRPINAAADAEVTRNNEAGATYAAIVQQHYPGRELGKLNAKIFIPAINGSLSKEGRLAVALNWGNETSRDRILADPKRNWNLQQAQAILDTLDENDWAFVQATWDFIGTFWPEIEAKHKRITGVSPERVEPADVHTRFGTFRGGYYPLVYDGRMHPRAAHHVAVTEAKLAMAGAATAATTRRGHTIARVENVTLPVRLDLGVAFQHLAQVIHDLTHHEMLIDTTRLLRDEKVSTALFATKGDLIYQQFTSALQDIALGSTSGGGKPHGTDAAVNYMRTGTQIAGLGLNLWTAFQQPLGLFNGMSRVGPVWVARGMKRWLRDATSLDNTATWIGEVSPMMRHRWGTATQDLHDLRGQLHKPGGWFDALVRTVSADHLTRQTITDGFLWHIGIAQRVADIPTWLGGYEKAMAAGEPEDRAIALADQGVLDSQGGGQIKDLAAIQRGVPIAKLFMTFYSYGNMLGNATAERAGATNFRSPASIVAFMGHLGLLYVMPALGTIALSRLTGKSGGGDDDEQKFLADVGSEILSTAMNTMVLVREFAGLARVGGARGYEGPAGARLIQLGYAAIKQVEQGDVDAALVRSLNALGGVLFHYPAAQVQRTIDGFVALDEGRTSNPAALLVGAPAKAK